MPRLFIFLDTNTFLHYVSLDQIDWIDFIEAKDIVLVIAPVVIRELNKHKDFPRTPKMRERASTALQKLAAWSRTPSPIIIRNSVELQFQFHDPSIDFTAKNLLRDVADDYLIATIIEHQSEHSDCIHMIVTEDLGLELKAKAFGFFVRQVPSAFRLADELLASEKRISDLESQVKRLQNRIPVLRLAFYTGENHLNVTIRGNEELSLDSIKDKMTQIYNKHPKLEAKLSEDPGIRIGEVLIPIANFSNNGITDKDIQEYNESLDRYYEEYEKYISLAQDFLNLQNRTVKIDIVLLNEGTCPAEDIDIFMHFPDGFTLTGEDELPKQPKSPKAPTPPRTFIERMNDVFLAKPAYLSSLMDRYPTFKVPAQANVSYPLIRRTKSYDVEVKVRKAKHRLPEPLDTLYIVFNSPQEARSFTIDFDIHAANLPDVTKGQLHVIVG